MCERMKVPVPRAASSPSAMIKRASPTNTRRLPLIQRPSATTGPAFNLVFTRPLKSGPVAAEGRWISGKRRVFVAEARLLLPDGEEAARGTGTFMRSHIPLSSLAGYRA